MGEQLPLPEWVRCGVYTDPVGCTGMTVFHFPMRARAEAMIRGYATGTRHFDRLLHPFLGKEVDALVFSGGSVFGFPAADGVVQWLREHKQGEQIRGLTIPIVPQAVLFDLLVGTPQPLTARAGYDAMFHLSDRVPVGNEGAGCGATVGKLLGPRYALKSGGGYAALGEPFCAVYIVLNAFGEVIDPENCQLLAGVRGETPGTFQKITPLLLSRTIPQPGENTTLIAAFLEGSWEQNELRYLAYSLLQALAHMIHPAGSLADGDLCVVFASGKGGREEVFTTGLKLEKLLYAAIRNAIESAHSLAGIPSRKEWCHGI